MYALRNFGPRFGSFVLMLACVVSGCAGEGLGRGSETTGATTLGTATQADVVGDAAATDTATTDTATTEATAPDATATDSAAPDSAATTGTAGDTATDTAFGDGDGGAVEPPEVVPPVLAAMPSTRGTEFWVGFMENLALASNGPPTFAFFLSAESATTARVEIPQTGYTKVVAVPAGETVKVTMPGGALYPQSNEVPTKVGIRISADDPIDVVAVHYRLYFSEATRILPTPELADRYVIITAADEQGVSPSEFVVVATEDDTVVEITPSVTTSGFLPAGAAKTFPLARGESMQFQASGDLSGSHVVALGGQRLAVFAGARQAHVACIGADSHLWDQMLPVARWGTSYVVLPLAEAGATPVKIVSDRYKTTAHVSCQDSAVVSPGAGKTVAIAKPTLITASHPIGVAVFVKSGNCMAQAEGDPNFMVVPPAGPQGLTTESLAWTALDDFDTLTNAHHWLSIVVPTADVERVTLDGETLAGNPALAPVEGAPELMAGQVAVAGGAHHLVGSEGARFQALLYGLANFDAYSFGGGYDCSDCAPLTTATPPSACDPGDLRLDTPGHALEAPEAEAP